ncbi:Smr/MutS family protein [Paenibacillus kandeliae]|uniref:Smr/MutS family protein n=1 Tax=Paenibacillus kandeliae TaxID=3231269 RepID=UPI00345985F2
MNIGSLFRGMMGDSKPGEAKQMELKEGQVVRGVVTSVSEDGQEAVVQIQGVKVRAKLETPLQQGATTLLQVQPPGKDGMPVLKPVTANTTGQQPTASMNDLLESMSLPDTKDNREMITQMRSAGIPLTAENAKNIQASLAQKPSSVPLGEWVQSAGVAIQRGLPVTGQSVAGLQQAIFGPPLHESLGNLDNLLRAVASQTLGNAALADDAVPNGTLPANTTTAPNNTASTNGSITSAANNPNAATTAGMTANANTAATAGLSTGTAQLLDKLQNVIRQLNTLIPQTEPNNTTPQQPANTTGSNQGQSAAAEGQQTANAATQTQAATPSTTQGTTNSSPWLGQVLKLLGAEYEQQTVRAALTLTSTPASVEQSNGQPTANTNTANSNATNANQAAEQAARNITGNTPAPINTPIAGNAIPTPAASLPPQVPQPPNAAQTASAAAAALPDLLEAPDAPQAPLAPATGYAHAAATSDEQTTAQQTNTTNANAALRGTANPTDSHLDPANLIPAAHVSAEETIAKAQDTLKGLLLQLSNADDAPPVLKDAAQQLVQQLTGQQLLLNTDRTAPFAQVTMFVPFNGPEGQETASVQIQSRRGGKGELDASNCRLWFDLDMKSLGQTLLDVQVVDRIVTLKVHNDQEQLAPFVESKKQEIADAVGNLGYQLLSLQFAPLPVRSTADSLMGSTTNSDVADQYAPPEYRGVDMKI